MSLSITPRQENEVLTGYQLNPSFEATFFCFPFPFLLFLKKKKKKPVFLSQQSTKHID
jgi:hypothetical protein